MRIFLLAVPAAASVAFSATGFAQTAQTPAPAASPHTLTANIALVSDYRFRGLSQTFQRPALQGGFDYSHASGLYLGNWNSNVSSSLYPNGNLEMDFYGGYKGTVVGDVGFDVGALYYYYPGTNATLVNNGETHTGRIDNGEIYGALSWKWFTVKYSHAVTDFFSIPDTRGSGYLDASATYDLGGGWGLNGHVGHQKVRHQVDGSYSDWKLGVTKDVSGWVFGASYVDTNARDSVYRLTDSGGKTINIGRSGVVLSVGRTF